MELPKTELPKGEPAKEEPKTPATEKPADTKPAEKPAEAKPAETPAKEAPKATEKPADTKPAEPVKTEKPAETEKPKTPAESKPATPPEKKPEEKKPADAKPDDAKPAETPKPDEKSSATGQSVFRLVSETSAAETPAAEDAVAKPDDNAKPDTATSDVAKPADAKAEPAPAAGSGEKIEYIPLEEVKEDIRQTLAREQAATRMDKAFAPIRDKMSQYRDKWVVAVADEEGEEGEGEETVEVKNLPPLDVAAMAKEANLEYEKTSWIDRIAAEKLPIAASTLGGTSYFIPVVFDDRYPEFRPGISEDMEGNQYLFWVVAEKPERVPKFDDKGVREEVLQAWKMIEARKLAKKEAESLIEKAKKADKSLKGEFGGKPGFEVLQPKEFSWLTRGLLPSVTSQPARISSVEGVLLPGHDFMKAVFALSKGEFGVAMNNPQTIAYAVEMIDLKPSQKVLWELFRVDDFGRYADAGYNDQFERITTWRKGLEEEAGLKWERKPAPHESGR